MAVFKNSKMDNFYRDLGEDLPWLDVPCEVTITDKIIKVEYYDDDGKVTYSGYESRPGVYTLKGSDCCDACLYGSPDLKVLYGGWKLSSSTSSGVWCIKLGLAFED